MKIQKYNEITNFLQTFPSRVQVICLFGALVDTDPADNGRSLVFGSAPVFELMARMACQFPSRIGMYDIVDALMRHTDTLPFQSP